MVESIPLSAFENALDSMIVSDAKGKLCLVNESARRLLKLDGQLGDGLPCWSVCKLKTSRDTSFCGPHCPIQRLALGGVSYSRRNVIYSSGQEAHGAELFSIAIPPMSGGRCAVFHLIAPHEERSARRAVREPRHRRETHGALPDVTELRGSAPVWGRLLKDLGRHVGQGKPSSPGSAYQR